MDHITGVQLLMELLGACGLGVMLAVFMWLSYDEDGI